MAGAKTGRKRTHCAVLKAGVLAAGAEPGASVGAISLAHGLNTNLVHKWRRQAARAMTAVVRKPADTVPVTRGSEFVALPLPPAMAEIRVEIHRGTTAVELRWPRSVAGECASWLGT